METCSETKAHTHTHTHTHSPEEINYLDHMAFIKMHASVFTGGPPARPPARPPALPRPCPDPARVEHVRALFLAAAVEIIIIK